MNNTHDISILIIYTGGTIGMMEDSQTGSLSPFDFGQILEHVPELGRFGYSIQTIAFEPPVDSSDIKPDTWIKIARLIRESYYSYNGFVVLHGSDTMAFSASALSFMLENLAKPVIFTGSQLPIGKIRTDGKENIITAVEIAAAQKRGKPIISEVCIYFENKLYRGNRTTKYNAENFNAFRSANYPFLAEAGLHINFNYQFIHTPAYTNIFRVHTKIDNNVAILKLFPGVSQNYVEAILNIKDLRAVVLETFGSGNAPTDKWFIELLETAIRYKGIVILNVTQCMAGSVVMGRYVTSIALKSIGVLNGNDITTEAAVTKLMFLLGQDLSPEKMELYLNNSISGEVTLAT